MAEIEWTFTFQARFSEDVFSQYQGTLSGSEDLHFMVQETVEEMQTSDIYGRIRVNTMIKDIELDGRTFRVVLNNN